MGRAENIINLTGAGSSRLSAIGLNGYFRSSRQSSASVAPAAQAGRRPLPKQASHRRGSSLSGGSPDVLAALVDTVRFQGTLTVKSSCHRFWQECLGPFVLNRI